MPQLRGAIRASYIPGKVRMADLAKEYGVSTQAISITLRGKTWGWLSGDGSTELRSADREGGAMPVDAALRSMGIAPPVLPDNADWSGGKLHVTLHGESRGVYCPFDDGDRYEQLKAAIELLAGIAVYDRARARWAAEEAEHRETDAQYLEAVLDHAEAVALRQ